GMPVDFTEVYQNSEKKVYRFLLGLSQNESLAEELTEETFYQAFLHINQFEGRSSMDTWLCQIAKNLYFKEMKRRKRFDDKEIDTNLSDSGENLFLLLEEKQKTIEIHRILKTLNNTYKEVFTLHIFAELTFKEIAEIYDKSESWAKMSFYRAKAELINRLEEQNEN
ncbi:MAG: RNA polymerase sigma factor, partial [Eubacterium sp.]|nr:RNA polymerase sigma factor [Eubacterium sp.]